MEEKPPIKIFDKNDKSLKMIGELLSNDSSRQIIRCLIEKEMYTNEIAKKLQLRVSLVIHHLKKLEELELLEITEKQIVKNGNKHKFYRMVPNLGISPNHSEEELKENGFFKKIFNSGVKISVVAFGCLTSWFSGLNRTIPINEQVPRPQDEELVVIPWSGPIPTSDNFFLIPIIIIGCSLFMIWFTRKRK